MRVPITKQMSLEDLKSKLETSHPELKCAFRGKSILVVKSSSTAAALVMSRGGKAIVNEGFPSMGGQLLFVLCMLLLGILIPLIVYFAAFFPKQKEVRNKVAEFIKKEYN